MAVDITALYCCLDDFCKVFADWEAHRLLPSEQARQRSGKLSRAEMLFIVVLFHLSPYKNFKVFYLYGIGGQYRACFDELPHYDRFVSLMPRLFVPLMVLLHGLSGEPTGVYFVDSTKLAVCHNRRIHRHKVFDGLAARGKTSMGWFYGLKLHFVINHKGLPRSTVDWDTSQADDFRTRGGSWTIKRTSLERGRALRSDRKSLAQRRSGAVAGCRDSARLRRCCGCCGGKTWRPSRASWASRRRRSPAGTTASWPPVKPP